MTLKEKLNADLKDAMRAKDQVRLLTIRALKAAILEKEVSERVGGEATLSEEQALAVFQKQAKQRIDAIEQYKAANREDLWSKEAAELAIIQAYLPEQMSDEDITAVVKQILAETGVTDIKGIGKVMGVAVGKLRGKADGKRIQDIVKSLLSA